ncbi:MAG: hypothetical protein HRU16_06655, partial [Planctomycetes bacterium]|nr:hypothetical protein [Planctomycetota bacterium]
DDDGDGLIDCADPDCAADPACSGGGNQGDECNDPLIAVVGSNAVDTTAMTSSADPYNDAACAGTALGVMAGDAWYQFSAPVSGTATVSTCDLITFDSDLVAYTGTCGALTEIACNGDAIGCGGFTSLMEMSVTAGTNYLIRIGGWSLGEQGTGTLEITLAGAPNPENCTNGTDDDGDGDVDCEDTDCDQDPACATPPENCSNGVDDDGDGLTDCNDPDCAADRTVRLLPVVSPSSPRMRPPITRWIPESVVSVPPSVSAKMRVPPDIPTIPRASPLVCRTTRACWRWIPSPRDLQFLGSTTALVPTSSTSTTLQMASRSAVSTVSPTLPSSPSQPQLRSERFLTTPFLADSSVTTSVPPPDSTGAMLWAHLLW